MILYFWIEIEIENQRIRNTRKTKYIGLGEQNLFKKECILKTTFQARIISKPTTSCLYVKYVAQYSSSTNEKMLTVSHKISAENKNLLWAAIIVQIIATNCELATFFFYFTAMTRAFYGN